MYKVILDGYVLYSADSSARLADPVLELETGYAGVFTATVPPEHPLYDKIFCRRSMLSVFRNDTEIFTARCERSRRSTGTGISRSTARAL